MTAHDPDRSARRCVPAVASGAWRFALVSVGAFSVWAFGGRWFRDGPGEGALFAAVGMAFLALAGLVLPPLVSGPRRVARFYRAFAPAFLAYAVVWSVGWFTLGFGVGEWLGSLFGSIAFVLILMQLLGGNRGLASACAVFFVLHTAGYFAGGGLMRLLFESARSGALDLSRETIAFLGPLTWGLFYGLGFGAGLGYVLWAMSSGLSELQRP